MSHHRPGAGTSGVIFHVLNRGVRRLRLFDDAGDYQAVLSVLAEARARVPVQVLAYCLMPNHFHLIVRPTADGQLSAFMQWFTATHSKRWHGWRGTTGTGSVYQGRFKAFPVQSDTHFLTVCRYVEQNALRAGLVSRAEDWPWCSLGQRSRKCNTIPTEAWPILQPENWIDLVNFLEPTSEAHQVRRALVKSSPYGDRAWTGRIARDLGLDVSARKRRR